MKHIVALSGGKDSTAMALRLAEVEPRDYIYVCTPTGDELPEMIEHWKRLGELLGKSLVPVTSGHSLQGLIRKWTALPNHRARWCTRVLKIEPYYHFLAEQGECTSYVGLRADEESRQGMLFPETSSVVLRFPMREWGWSVSDVWKYLDKRGVKVPGRTDCARCYHQQIGEWWNLWKDHGAAFEDAAAQERHVSEVRGKQHTFRSPQRDSWATDLTSLGVEFSSGEIPKNAGQIDLFGLENRATMCRVCSL